LPTPEAAYALLRWEANKQGWRVECRRYALSPTATRVDLVSLADLRTGLARRRAIFHWIDTTRARRLVGYAIQKIAADGATYLPLPESVVGIPESDLPETYFQLNVHSQVGLDTLLGPGEPS
jgi:hypothetical protein